MVHKRYSVCSLTPSRRHASLGLPPASTSFSTPTSCSSVNLLLRIVRSSLGRNSHYPWTCFRGGGQVAMPDRRDALWQVERAWRPPGELFEHVAAERDPASPLPPMSATEAMVADIVLARQRPGTAKGIVFISLEDETGIVNIIVPSRTFEAQRLVCVSEAE